MRVLIVDDIAADLQVFADAVRQLGHEVVTASNGEEGVALGRQQQFDLVVTDLVMPLLSGLGLILAGRLEGWLTCSVIVMTAYRSDELASVPGVVAILAKPADPAELTAAVVAAVGKREGK